MIIKNYKSSTFSITTEKTKVLFDPWLIDGEYYGSWNHFPPIDIDFSEFNEYDFICLTHIHPDHFSKKTLQKINKNIPVIILDYKQKFLKLNLELLGFNVIELKHGSSLSLNDISIKVFAADNCNPELCKKFFGCGIFGQKNDQSNQIDSIFVIKQKSYTLVNTNDVPFQLARDVLKKIKKEFPKIDLLLVGYSGAGPYPQCFDNLDDLEKLKKAEEKKISFLEQSLSTINVLEPKLYMPFAGQYTLGGKLSKLNKFRGSPNLIEARNYLNNKLKNNSKCILLNSNIEYNLNDKKLPEFSPSFFDEEESYINNYLTKIKFDYETQTYPKMYELTSLIEKSFLRFEKKRNEIKYFSKTKIIIKVNHSKYLVLYMNGDRFKILEPDKIVWNNYVLLDLDQRLLFSILKGPKYAHWNNAEIGSHIQYFRSPDIYERSLFYCLNFFHQ